MRQIAALVFYVLVLGGAVAAGSFSFGSGADSKPTPTYSYVLCSANGKNCSDASSFVSSSIIVQNGRVIAHP